MEWKDINELMYNRKGYMHHPDTPPADKEFYVRQKEKARELLQIGLAFIQNEGVLSHRSQERGKEELGSGARYLHRGMYCPSPVLDILIANAKRGKILVRPSARSHITNRYVYDTSGRLLFSDNYIDDRMVSSEYLLYRGDTVYGVTINMDGRLYHVSEEKYVSGRLQTYVYGFYQYEFYQNGEKELVCGKMECEEYHYDDEGLRDWEFYQLNFNWGNIAPSGFIKHDRYRLERENGYLKSYTCVNNDGSPIDGSYVHEIKLKRKA